MLMYMYMLFVFMGLFSFGLKRKHLLMMLMSVEFMVLSIYLIIFNFLSFYSNEYFLSMYYLTFCVCGGVLGLSVLVSMIRSHGNDYFQGFNCLW